MRVSGFSQPASPEACSSSVSLRGGRARRHRIRNSRPSTDRGVIRGGVYASAGSRSWFAKWYMNPDSPSYQSWLPGSPSSGAATEKCGSGLR